MHTLDIAPLRSESPPQKRSGMARVLKGSHSFTCTPTLRHGTTSTSLRSRHIECDCVTVASKRRLDAPVVPAIYPAHPIHGMSPIRKSVPQPVTSLVKSRRLQLFGHCPSRTGSRPCTRTASFHQSSPRGLSSPKRSSTRQSWLRTVEANLKPLNFGLHTACGRLFRLAECHGNGHDVWRAYHSIDAMTKFYGFFSINQSF